MIKREKTIYSINISTVPEPLCIQRMPPDGLLLHTCQALCQMVKRSSKLDTHLQIIYLLLKTNRSIVFIGYREKKNTSGELRNLSEVIQLEIKYRCAQPLSSPFFYYSTISKHGMCDQKVRRTRNEE